MHAARASCLCVRAGSDMPDLLVVDAGALAGFDAAQLFGVPYVVNNPSLPVTLLAGTATLQVRARLSRLLCLSYVFRCGARRVGGVVGSSYVLCALWHARMSWLEA